MKRKLAVIFACAAMLDSMLVTLPAHANNSTGIALGSFSCNITLAFPVLVKQSAKTNCQGDAFGVGVGLLGSKQGQVGLAVGSTDVKDSVHNYLAYNIEYSLICASGEPFPLLGMVQGHTQTAGTNLLTGAVKRTHSIFQSTSVGVFAVTLLFETHTEAGGLSKAHKTKKGGAALDPKTPGLIPDGVGLAVVEAKQPVGSCATPNPQQEIQIVGFGITTAGLNELL